MRVSDTRTIVFATPNGKLKGTTRSRAFLASVDIKKGLELSHVLLKFDAIQNYRDYNVCVEELHDLRAVLDEAIAEIEGGK